MGAAFVAALAIPHHAHARPITLDEALAAVDDAPVVQAADASVEEAEGNLDQADTRAYNPFLSVAAGPSFGADDTAYDFEVGIGQVLELGGKRNKRARVAAAERDAASEALAATRAFQRAEVWRTFHLALVAQERVAVAAEDEAAARELSEAAAERQRLGAATQTEINVAAAGLGRATAARKATERDVVLARAELAAAIGTSDDLEPSGLLPVFPDTPADEDALVAAALSARRDLAAIERTRDARAAEVAVADAVATPDLELSVSWSRSAVEDIDAVFLGVRIDVPLWNRNRGGRRAARAARKRATIEVDAARKQVERDVRSAVKRYRAAIDAVAAFDRDVIGSLADNLKLARESQIAGKFDLIQLNTVRREFVESQLVYLDSLAEAVEARAALELVTARSLEAAP